MKVPTTRPGVSELNAEAIQLLEKNMFRDPRDRFLPGAEGMVLATRRFNLLPFTLVFIAATGFICHGALRGIAARHIAIPVVITCDLILLLAVVNDIKFRLFVIVDKERIVTRRQGTLFGKTIMSARRDVRSICLYRDEEARHGHTYKLFLKMQTGEERGILTLPSLNPNLEDFFLQMAEKAELCLEGNIPHLCVAAARADAAAGVLHTAGKNCDTVEEYAGMRLLTPSSDAFAEAARWMYPNRDDAASSVEYMIWRRGLPRRSLLFIPVYFAIPYFFDVSTFDFSQLRIVHLFLVVILVASLVLIRDVFFVMICLSCEREGLQEGRKCLFFVTRQRIPKGDILGIQCVLSPKNPNKWQLRLSLRNGEYRTLQIPANESEQTVKWLGNLLSSWHGTPFESIIAEKE